MYDQMQEKKRKDVLHCVTRVQYRCGKRRKLASFLGGSEPAEAHHVHHIVGAVNLHRRVLRKLETGLFFLGLLCGLFLCTGGQLLVADLGKALVKVESLRLRRLLGLCA